MCFVAGKGGELGCEGSGLHASLACACIAYDRAVFCSQPGRGVVGAVYSLRAIGKHKNVDGWLTQATKAGNRCLKLTGRVCGSPVGFSGVIE